MAPSPARGWRQRVEITSRMRETMPVHIFGTPCDMDAVATFAEAHRLKAIDGAAQAHLIPSP